MGQVTRQTVQGDPGHTERCQARIHSLLSDIQDMDMMRCWLQAAFDDVARDVRYAFHREFDSKGLPATELDQVIDCARRHILGCGSKWVVGMLSNR